MLCPSQDAIVEQADYCQGYLEDLCHGDGDFAMMKAYLDESGIHDQIGICVVAGFVVSSSGAWQLSKEWQDNVLFKYRIPYFHAREFAARRGPFEGWIDAKVRQFSIDAVAVINTCIQDLKQDAFIASAVSSKAFFALSVDERRWLTGGQFVESRGINQRKWRRQGAPTKPYFLLFQQSVYDTVGMTENKNFQGDRLGTGDVIHFVFDQQKQYEATAKAVYGAMKNLPLVGKERMGDVVFTSKLRAVPLQVADFIAYESFCYLTQRESGGQDCLSNQAERLLGGFRQWRSRYVYINDHVLKELLRASPLIPRERFIPPGFRMAG